MAPTFGGVNLEDISAPRCFEIERRLRAELDIPVFHDDQHGTAIVVLAALLNALRIVDKRPEDVRVVVVGAGAAVVLGLSGPGAITAAGVRRMAPGAIVFAMANPVPEVQPEEVRDDVAIMATGRSDYPNQINNVLAFPGVFKGALDVRARTINEEMKLAAAQAIARVIPPDELHAEYVIPSVFNRKVAESVADGVANAAVASGVARRTRGAAHEAATALEAGYARQ